jgi:hypothetical protein
MNHQNQLEQMANGSTFSTGEHYLGLSREPLPPHIQGCRRAPLRKQCCSGVEHWGRLKYDDIKGNNVVNAYHFGIPFVVLVVSFNTSDLLFFGSA